MTRKECFAALGLNDGADQEEVKRAYRKLAFALHPDLHPDEPDAAKRFQRVNEAYVLLSRPEQSGKTRPFQKPARSAAEESTAKMREEAQRAYARARQGREFSCKDSQQNRQEHESEREDVLKDILNDPFARRVFEDIYSHIQEEKKRRGKGDARTHGTHAAAQRTAKAHAASVPEFGVEAGAQASLQDSNSTGARVVGKLKNWLRRQIDDEQVLRLPSESLTPGARVRLQIQHGLGGETQVVELTLPPEFVPGKTMRLKGMGKRIGNWRGDLYVRLEPA
ncbi:MAG: DnaJ domain-containing protein [Desulfovibrio sp.]|jgi:molecular chaperone DnaJ|nr:DnaJ domain-containing protein [Desulfovibrio sp.]